LGSVLWVIGMVAKFAYYVHVNSGPLNSLEDSRLRPVLERRLNMIAENYPA
jgi:hypothetical protein